MKKLIYFIVALFIIINSQILNAQNREFKMEGVKSEIIEINKIFSSSDEIFPFKKNGERIYGLEVTADISLKNEQSLIRLILVDKNFEEFLIYESYSLLSEVSVFSIEEICEETAVLNGIKAHSVKIEIENAEITLKNLIYSTQLDPAIKIEQVKREKKQAQNEEKINKINKNLRAKGKKWVAGLTSVAQLTYAEKKQLFGQSTFTPGFEYYAGGVISTSTSDSEQLNLKSATASPYVNEWDWRNRHGQNWISPVTDQGLCGSCWAFAAAGATEAMVNLFYNQKLNLDLSEQELISCSDAGSCSGGYPYRALNYIAGNGIGDEGNFPYMQTNEECSAKGSNPSEIIKIGGRFDFGSSAYPKTEDVLKKMLIEMGPLSGGLSDWAHAMTLVGYKVVKEGDNFYYRDLNLQRYWITVEAGDPLIDKTVWIFKNSWGERFGDEGYIYVETPITNISNTHGLETPVTSLTNDYEVICEDKDGDGYYWWGLGEKPEHCDCPDEPDGDDSDPTLGPLDEYGNCIKLAPTLAMANVPADQNLGCNPELSSCDTGVTATDGCSEATVVCTPGEITEDGCQRSQTFTYTATDDCGNTASATTTYTWTEDFTPPVLANVPADQNLGCNPELPSCDLDVTATDGCGNATLICTSGEITENGCERNQTFTYTATDDCGNTATATTTYTWTEDFTSPVLVNVPVDEDLGHNPELPTCDAGVTATDDCSNATVTCIAGEIIQEGNDRTQTFTYLAADECGNTASATTTYTWTEEQIAPVLSGVPADENLGCNPELPSCDIDVTATNGCSEATVVCTPGDILEDGCERSQTFTYTATDDCGNTVSATTTYTWTEDFTPPVLANVPADQDLGCNPELPSCDIDVTATDGCSEATVVCTPGDILEDGCERSQVFTYTATDECGNIISATTTYTWTEDLTPPVLANVPVDEDLGHNPEFPTCDAVVTVTDDCSNATVTCISGEIIQEGNDRTQTFTYLAADECGNTTSATTTYTWTEGTDTPVADFTATYTNLTEGENNQFEDLSMNTPESWSWVFEGGTPATSTLKNPVIKYDSPGNFRVTLTVTNAGGSNTKTVENFIAVEENLPEYCLSNGDASEEWISSVTVGTQTHQSNSTGPYGYMDYSESVAFNAEAGTNVNFSLIPAFLNRWYYEYVRIWIDYNGDFDFDDPGELVFSSSQNRSTVSGSFTIPADVSGTTRIRISMKRDAFPEPCETFSKGEVKDYTLHIEEPTPQPPVADFTVSQTNINIGETVQFTDLSSNAPTHWKWYFPGGNPEQSTEQNPTVSYDSSGEFDVTLVVSKDGFEPSETIKTKYIVATEVVAQDYCTPKSVNSSNDYIENVTIESVLNSSSAGSGYTLSSNTVSMTAGQNYSVTLSPKDLKNRNYWRIWIDFNADGDFDDSEETLLAINNKKGTVTSSITIPSSAAGVTRMRIAMRNNSAPSPCDNNFDGEMKDYPVSIDTAPQASSVISGNNERMERSPGVKIYPNPVSQILTIQVDEITPGGKYSVYNMNGGRVLYHQILSEETILDLSDYSPGIYLVVIENNNRIFREKIVKK